MFNTMFFSVIVSFFLFISCSSEHEKIEKKMLDIILADDLVSIIDGIEDSALLDSSYFVIRSYKEYKDGKYYVKADVDFFFLNGISAKIVRKYRYQKIIKKWDRYFNEYRFYDKQSVEN